MTFEERVLQFSCHGASLLGILSLPVKSPAAGVLIVVGGPQYRAGSHRQFTLLARTLASQGVPVMRFDYRGMGDSEGAARSFEQIDDDLRCAIDHFFEQAAGLKTVVIWGLCDAASAALFYAHRDPRVNGLVLLNPWVRSAQSVAKAHLKHYYVARLFTAGFWKKIVSGRFDIFAAGRSFQRMVGDAFFKKNTDSSGDAIDGDDGRNVALHDRMADGLSRFGGKVLLILSGEDLTAREFSDVVRGSRRWRALMNSSNVKRLDLPAANHTFSRREWRDKVAAWTLEWIDAL